MQTAFMKSLPCWCNCAHSLWCIHFPCLTGVFHFAPCVIAVTPRDLREPGQQSNRAQDQNFRFKGYPEKHFEGLRHPITGVAPDETELQGVKLREIQGSEQHARKQFFDTRKMLMNIYGF